MKSRMDVVDTLVEYQQEVRVLRFLLFLFYLTAAYELLYLPLSEGGDIAADAALALSAERSPRKGIAPGRLKNVQKSLENIVQASPVFRSVFAPEIASLTSIASRLNEKRDDLTAQHELIQQVKRLWSFCHHPSLADPGLFKELKQDLKSLMGALAIKPLETLAMPHLELSPRRPAGSAAVSTAKRDIFHFEGPENK